MILMNESILINIQVNIVGALYDGFIYFILFWIKDYYDYNFATLLMQL